MTPAALVAWQDVHVHGRALASGEVLGIAWSVRDTRDGLVMTVAAPNTVRTRVQLHRGLALFEGFHVLRAAWAMEHHLVTSVTGCEPQRLRVAVNLARDWAGRVGIAGALAEAAARPA